MRVVDVEIHYGESVRGQEYVVWLLKIGHPTNVDMALASFPTLTCAREYAEGAGKALKVPVVHDGGNQ